MDEIYDRVKVGTPVVIVRYKDGGDQGKSLSWLKSRQHMIMKFLGNFIKRK